MYIPLASSTLIFLSFNRSRRCSMVDFFQLRMLTLSGAAWRRVTSCWGVADGVPVLLVVVAVVGVVHVKKSNGRPTICLLDAVRRSGRPSQRTKRLPEITRVAGIAASSENYISILFRLIGVQTRGRPPEDNAQCNSGQRTEQVTQLRGDVLA